MNSPFGYFGGKSRLAGKIIKHFPDHTCYCEPFCGAAWVFFKKEPSETEVLNDKDEELVNFFRIVQNHLEEFLNQFKYFIISRKIFEIFKRQDEFTLTDIQRAVKFFYLIKNTYGTRPIEQNFRTWTKGHPSLNLLHLEETLLEVYWRMVKVLIENLDYHVCIEKYDRPHTLFYIDPPYYGIKGYKFNLKHDDFLRMSEILSGIKGKFLLSLNDIKAVRKIFKGFRIIGLDTKYTMRYDKESRDKIRKEVLIKNF